MRTQKPIPDSLKKKKKARIGLLAVLCFRLFSSRAFPKTFQIYLLGTFTYVCSALNWLPLYKFKL